MIAASQSQAQVLVRQSVKCVLCYSTVLQYRDITRTLVTGIVIYKPQCISEGCRKMGEDLLASFVQWLRNLHIKHTN